MSGKRDPTGVDMHAAKLGAAMQCREYLAGIEQALVVEGALDALLLIEIDLRKHHRHQVALLDADAMLAGEHAADLDAEPEDVGAELLGAIELAGIVGVIKDQRMQIAIAGVKHIGDAQAVLGRHFLHAHQNQRQLGARNGAVHAQVVGRDAADRGECRLTSSPEQQPLVFRVRHPARDRAALLRDLLDAFEQMIDLGARAIELDDQQRLDVERIAGMNEFLDRMDRRPVHHLHAARNDAGADDARHAFAAILGFQETDQGRARGLRTLENAHGNFRDNAKQTFGPGNDAEQIVTAGIQVTAAEPYDFAGYQDQFAAEQIIRGHAVFEAVHAAGIFRDIAADRAGDLRGRIGRVVEAGMLDRLRDREIGYPGLDHGDTVVVVDLKDAIEFGHAEQHAVTERQRAAR